jgi:hypothetical protein
MYNGNKNNKSETKIGRGEHKDCKEDKLTNNSVTDLHRRYLHDIRNLKILDKEMINNIRNMSNEEKMDIIITLNDVIEGLITLLE